MDDELDFNPHIVVCRECEGAMIYKGTGRYVCEKCGHEEFDDYGKVRRFLETNGPSNIFEISEGTGLPRTKVTKLFKEGRLEVAKNSDAALICRRCGMPIRAGEYCSRCEAEMSGLENRNRKRGIYNVLNEDGTTKDGKMRFLEK